MRTYKVTEGRIATAQERIMTLTQQWRYLNLNRNSFHILFPVRGIVGYRQIISSRLCSFERYLFTR